jgi:hypothetical protein
MILLYQLMFVIGSIFYGYGVLRILGARCHTRVWL